MLEIDWHVIFEYLNINEEFETCFKTNAHLSKQKRMKVQRLIEEMPMIEQMKKSSMSYYLDEELQEMLAREAQKEGRNSNLQLA